MFFARTYWYRYIIVLFSLYLPLVSYSINSVGIRVFNNLLLLFFFLLKLGFGMPIGSPLSLMVYSTIIKQFSIIEDIFDKYDMFGFCGKKVLVNKDVGLGSNLSDLQFVRIFEEITENFIIVSITLQQGIVFI